MSAEADPGDGLQGARSPWLEIPASDYDAHMGPAGADQLAPLSRIFGELYTQALPAAVAVVGCATGNGFEHVDPRISKRLVGIDLNPKYLEVIRRRFPQLGSVLDLQCVPAERCDLGRGTIGLVYAALIFEYVAPERLLPRIADWLSPGGVLGTVLQLAATEKRSVAGEEPATGVAEGLVTRTAQQSLRALEKVMRLVAPEELVREAQGAGLVLSEQRRVPLRHGKAFHVGVFRKPSNAAAR